MKKCKRFLALFLVLCMMLSVVPFGALAEETTPEETTPVETTPVETTPVETTVEETTEATTPVETEPQKESIASFDLTKEAAGYAMPMGTKPGNGTTTDNPFVQGTGGSNSFRIPAMVTLNDGTIVAAADARWNTTYDGGGLDTIVSYSVDNGANWSYTFANYLGDNGNVYDGSSSTAFIDPALATDGSTLYMLCDLYPYGVALNGSGNTAPSSAVGFNSNGKLLLSNDNHSSYGYYLDGTTIYSSDGTAVDGLNVDNYFNVSGTYNGTTYDTNLFFSDSPFKVVRTGYLYLTKSTDGGKTWSEPTLIPNVKTSSEQVCLVGPGRGLVTGGKIIFPVYSYNGSSESQRMGFIYSTDGTSWTRVDSSISWSSEAAVVALSDGTLRFFYRNGTSALCYVDYSWTSGWDNAVNTGIATNSNTQISAISYSKTVDGKQVILVSCPTGSNSNGSADSSASARLNGKIFVGLVNSDNTMDWSTGTSVSLTSQHSRTNYFMYSCLTELSDGSIAILYEDNESAWGTGDNYYYQMSYSTIAASSFGMTFDTEENENIFVDGDDNGTGITINFGSAEFGNVTIAQMHDVTTLAGKTYVAYNIDVTGFNGSSATVTIPLNNIFADDAKLYAVYIDDKGAIAETIPGTYDAVDDTFTFTATHFSTYAVVEDANTSDITETKNIALTVGETSETFTDDSGNYSNNYTAPDPSIATIDVRGTDGQEGGVEYKVASVTCNTLISDNADSWTAASDYYYTPDSTNYYPVYAKRSAATKGSWWTYTEYTYTRGYKNSDSEPIQIRDAQVEGSRTSDGRDATPNITVYTQSKTDAIPASTTITFTGVSAGETKAVVGTTQYNITVTRKTETVNLTVGNTATYTDSSSKVTVADSTVASATLSNGTLTIQGLKDGTTTVTTDTTVYTVTVSDGTPISIKENETKTISVELADGQSVEWSSADSSYVGVAGKYDTTAGAYTNEAILAGQNVTSSPVTVTATIKDANGNVVRTEKWLVTVTQGDADTNSTSRHVYVNVTEILNCTVYYSINGGELIKINGTGVLIDQNTSGHFNIMFFAAPDEGYALTYMCVTGSGNQYYTLSNGNPDGTGSDAWPFVSNTQTTIPNTSGDSAWKSGHGFRWSLLEGNMTIDQMKVLFSNAIALGCDGATNFTKNGTDSFYTEVQFVAQPLPTMKKEVASITRNGSAIDTSEKVKIGDTINYTITVTKPAVLTGDIYTMTNSTTHSYDAKSRITDTNKPKYTNGSYGTITYSNVDLNDPLTNNNGISNPNLGTSGSSTQTYEYTTSLTLTKENFGNVVKGGTITNVAELTYTYQSNYSTGSINAKSSAAVEVTVEIPSYVVDFGLPVEISLTGSTSGAGSIVSCEDGQYGTAALNDDGTGFTYSPNKILQGVDYVQFTYRLDNDTTDYTYRVAIYPATTVYYEEGFATYSGSWTETGNKGSVKQTAQVAGSSKDEYGYDAAYANVVGASNGSQATSKNKGDTCTFTFTGTGFEVYANCDEASGYLSSVVIQNASGTTVKAYLVNTVASDGSSGATAGQATNQYNIPIISEQSLARGTYKVTITHIKNDAPIHIDGFRIYGTLNADTDVYVKDLEDNPSFIELRDSVLASQKVDTTNSQYAEQIAGNILSQVYATAGTTVGAVITSGNTEYTDTELADMLDNGPKNEIFLRANQVLTFTIETNREVQIGLKAPNATANCTIDVNGDSTEKTISTSTDMFYTVLNNGSSGEQTITITNKGPVILSVTKLKVCDDPNAVLGTLSEEDLIPAMLSLGFEKGPEPTVPFLDVAKGDWFYDAVKYVYENGLMYGTASDMFSPNSNATRGMIVTILYRESGSPDVNSDGANWWSDARVWAMENGISDGTNMDANITREQMAAMLYRYAKLMEADVSARGNLDKFSDREQISGWAMEAVQWAVGEKIIAGRTNGTLDPQGLATRAEVAAMLMRFDKKLG